ncbi:MAG: hypothetical protein KIS87_12565 [Phycisphaeraceae bacterium]|nr:hypothetical protein [Phycisphaeraceae bacterium]
MEIAYFKHLAERVPFAEFLRVLCAHSPQDQWEAIRLFANAVYEQGAYRVNSEEMLHTLLSVIESKSTNAENSEIKAMCAAIILRTYVIDANTLYPPGAGELPVDTDDLIASMVSATLKINDCTINVYCASFVLWIKHGFPDHFVPALADLALFIMSITSAAWFGESLLRIHEQETNLEYPSIIASDTPGLRHELWRQLLQAATLTSRRVVQQAQALALREGVSGE